MLGLRKCTKCGKDKEKSTKEFYFFMDHGKQRISSACKECEKKRVKERYTTEERYNISVNFRKKNWEKHTQNLLKDRISLRLQALKHYGGNHPKCTCCGEDRYEFLVLDHINDDGKEHRKLAKGGSTALYRWLKINNYPKGLVIACHNCNMAREFYGICPHQIKDYEHVTTIESALTRRNPKRERYSPYRT